MTDEFKVIRDDIKYEIDNAKTVALFAHTDCDCDCIGSMCALYQYLQEINKNVSMFCDSDIPEKYNFLNNIEKINKDNFSDNFDLMISLDTATSARLGKYEESFLKNSHNINIDHHASNIGYAKLNYTQPNYSSCGEVLYEIMKEFSYQISDGVATSLFAAISSDTNHFSNQNVSAKTYLYASELLDLKADGKKATTCLHKKKTQQQLKLAGYMASNLNFKNGVSYLLITLKIMKKLDVKSSDVSSFLSLISNVGDSKITIIIKEKEKNNFRFNLRSIDEYDVNKVATIFGGGGHRNAAGCTIEGKYKTVINRMLKECFKEIEQNKKIV